jgi:hypothetical protein
MNERNFEAQLINETVERKTIKQKYERRRKSMRERERKKREDRNKATLIIKWRIYLVVVENVSCEELYSTNFLFWLLCICNQ